MANEILLKELTPTVWADTTDYNGDGGTRTHQIDLTGLAAAAARQGAKADLGATRAPRYAVTARIEFASAPTDLDTVEIYMGPSLSATAATANPGGLTGADAAYTGTAGSTLAESLLQLDYIGTLTCTNDGTTVVLQQTWVYSPPLRYVSPVVVNSATPAFVADAVEMSITMMPLVDEVQ